MIYKIYLSILFFIFVMMVVFMVWPTRNESFRGGNAENEDYSKRVDELESVVQSLIEKNELLQNNVNDLLLTGFVDSPSTSDYSKSDLPDNGPWLVTVHGYVLPNYELYIREGGASGTIKAKLKVDDQDAYGEATISAMINGTSFYVDCSPSTAGRYLVTWRKFVNNI